MLVAQLVASARSKYGVPQGSNRFNDTLMLQYFNDAASSIATETDFPEATLPLTTVAGQREYQVPEVVKILRVYVIQNGVFATPLPGTDLPTLEGDILMTYDQSSGLIQGAPTNTPQWLAEAAQQYPLQNSPVTGTVPTAMPYFSVTASGQRGEFYHRGGYIGVVPPPAQSGLILAVDHVPLQPLASATSSLAIYPTVYTDALTWKMCAYMASGDRSQMFDKYNALAENEFPKLRTYVDNLWATKPKRFVPITKRSLYVGGAGSSRSGGW